MLTNFTNATTAAVMDQPLLVPMMPRSSVVRVPRVVLEDDDDCADNDEFTTYGTKLRPPDRAFQAGDTGLRATGRLAPLVTKGGRKAYEITLRRGKIHAEGSDMHAYLAPKAFFPSDTVRLSFKAWFDDNFPWGTSQKRVGGKLLGFRIGTGDAQGGDYSSTGASVRLTWALNGGIGPYLYPQVRKNYSKKRSGNIGWDMLDQSREVRGVSEIASGVHMFYPRDRDVSNWDLRLRKRRWNEIELACRLNTPGKHDGVLELTVNGVTKRIDSVRYRYDDARIESVKISTFFGGATDDYAPPADTKVWLADFGFSKS